MGFNEQNELQEAAHAASFVAFMLHRLLAIPFLLTSSALAQVGGDVSDLEAGLVARWDEVMPLDTEETLMLPANAEGMKLEDFSVAFEFQVEKQPDIEHGSHILALANESQNRLLDWHLGPKGFSITLEGRDWGIQCPSRSRWKAGGGMWCSM